ncbi:MULTISPECIES: FAD-binding oxidoreductase [Ensifer]|uniref:FAD-dependent oxidoreductase n=1 Tax=Ensifer canadensis TaxID=555315 RepID=A0AAW4FMA0_9HYPH|nr:MULTISPECIES: FAD-binding oxidoreductase [Ensifer]KQU73977.1 FAD-dependent oxidoreductase [Ensifer sp. Root31]KQW58430.1 FAD-dependent oxidoreductase [Ensifer sp. Root1252]KQY78406.1 FAD-dependent oxidoreductase [Ensifer sp. Root142]KRC67266.1 FAD-dependent oxidoreductase [Ensifer sp. Root231]KRC98343.1 FAD-dependent oxidoreductase [Ensifer sp. Root258]
MSESFDFIIVGKGMMGAAAARYLALSGARVALVGPDEPSDWANHGGVFSSHYDNARITRTIDDDPVWARLAKRSIDRYREIAGQSGIDFYAEVGCLIAGPAPGGSYDYIEKVAKARDALGVEAPLLDEDALSERFAWFRFPQGFAGIHEAQGAGYINPHALVLAQTICAEKAGARIVRSEVASVSEAGDRVVVTTTEGATLTAGRVIVAAGGFSLSDTLLPRPIDLVVKARTVFFAEVAADDLPTYDHMPSLIGASPEQAKSYYLLPPVAYADGKHYIKIGGDPTDRILKSEPEVRAWFRGSAGAGAAEHMGGLLAEVMPGFKPASTHFRPCVTSFTRHGFPYIGFAGGDRIAVVTGGNGQAAKSSDEIGRLGAKLVMDGRIDDPAYETDFAVSFR